MVGEGRKDVIVNELRRLRNPVTQYVANILLRGPTDIENVRNENDCNTTSNEWRDGQKGENTKLNSEWSEDPITDFTMICAF